MNSYIKDMGLSDIGKLSAEGMSKVLADKIPLEIRLRNAYISTMLLDTVCIISEKIFAMLAELRIAEFKGYSRDMHSIIDDYQKSNREVMRPQLYYAVQKKSFRFYDRIKRHLMIAEFSYNSQLINTCNDSVVKNCGMLISTCYTAKIILEYIIQYDRELTRDIQHRLGPFIRYTAEDNVFCVGILRNIKQLIRLLGGPDTLESKNIDLSYEIFKKEVSLIDIKDIS